MPEDWEPPAPSLGNASGASGEERDEEDEYPLAMLWLPNPEYRSGWETRRVKRKKPDGAPKGWRGLVR
jgi:hypothetical protein